MSRRELNTSRKIARKKNLFLVVLISAIIIMLALFILYLPMFDIKEIEITGNSRITSDDIKKRTELDTKQNIFAFSSSKAGGILLEDPYVKAVRIHKGYPDKLSIEITERKPRAYIEFNPMSSYLLIDEEGMVLEVSSYNKEELPVIVGLKFSDFVIGQVIEAENTESFESVVLLSHLFEKYGMVERMRVEIYNDDDIHFYINNIDVIFGSIENADDKIATIKAALPNVPEGARGFLDVQKNGETAVFKYLK